MNGKSLFSILGFFSSPRSARTADRHGQGGLVPRARRLNEGGNRPHAALMPVTPVYRLWHVVGMVHTNEISS